MRSAGKERKASTARVAAGEADGHAEEEAEGDRAQSQEQRGAAAEERAGEEITAVLVGAEQVLHARSLKAIENALLRHPVRREERREHGEGEHAGEDEGADGQRWVRADGSGDAIH